MPESRNAPSSSAASEFKLRLALEHTEAELVRYRDALRMLRLSADAYQQQIIDKALHNGASEGKHA